MDLHLTGKLAVVTGASKGIGLAVTTALAEEGARVVAGARTIGEDLSRLAARQMVYPVSIDLATAAGPADLIHQAVTTITHARDAYNSDARDARHRSDPTGRLPYP